MRHYLTILFLWVCTAAAAQSPNPRLTVNIPATTLEAALRLLEKESKLPFSYEYTRVQYLTVKARQYRATPLEIILKDLLQGTPLGFKRKGDNILIGPKQKTDKTLSGYVEDAGSGERLIGVAVAAPAFKAGTATNNYGFYSLTLPGDSLHLQVSYIGYQRLDTVIHATDDVSATIRLQPAIRQLGEVTVFSGQITQTSQMSYLNLPASQIEITPRFFGEADLLKTLQLMPGVKQGTEASSALLVRGGTPDQNLVLLDGAPLYNPMHLLGIFSTFNTSALKDVTLYKGAFPARYGGRISSVVDISMRDGNMYQSKGEFSIGLLAAQATFEGPVTKGKSSFIISARRTYPDLLISPIMKATSERVEKFSMFFYDVNAKFQHTFSDRDKLFLSVYTGQDKFRLKTRDVVYDEPPSPDYGMYDQKVQWGNLTGTLRWNHVYSPKLFSNTMLIGSRYRFNSLMHGEDFYAGVRTIDQLHLNSGIQDYGFRTDFDYRPHPAHTIKYGASGIYKIFTPGTTREYQWQNNTVLLDSVNNNRKINGTELDVYGEDDWEITSKLRLNAGLHWSAFLVEGRFYQSFQPRASLRFLLPGNWAVKGSYSRMTQYIHLLANNSMTLPTDLWVPATKDIRPQQADQFAVGVARNLFRNAFEFTLEGYYKKMHNVVEYKEGVVQLISSKNDSWQKEVTTGTADAYGVEAMLQKKSGKLTGWIAYTLAWAYRELPEVNFGKRFPYKYDRRHDLHITAQYKISKKVEMTGTWSFQSAAPFTIPVARYEGMDSPFPNTGAYHEMPYAARISGRNNIRLRAYHRLDIGFNFIKEKQNGNMRIWNISVLNVYNRLNPYSYYLTTYGDNSKGAELYGQAIVPFLPSFTYIMKFK